MEQTWWCAGMVALGAERGEACRRVTSGLVHGGDGLAVMRCDVRVLEPAGVRGDC